MFDSVKIVNPLVFPLTILFKNKDKRVWVKTATDSFTTDNFKNVQELCDTLAKEVFEKRPKNVIGVTVKSSLKFTDGDSNFTFEAKCLICE